ncbi:hypothetical protein Y032_0009g829 [Ancylostoma ceylanicum]|uniref:Uncharacterized protein n=1 Tax=Ancylostoma ceylanicum TaxID=53326 RepID=A0A016VK27_9BILA|nr:hypothetical protein Y032_0009g829 [Ancylostoma ceylanicum]
MYLEDIVDSCLQFLIGELSVFNTLASPGIHCKVSALMITTMSETKEQLDRPGLVNRMTTTAASESVAITTTLGDEP